MMPSTSWILKLAQRCLCEDGQVVFRVPAHRCMPHLSSPTQPSPAPHHTAQPSPAQTSPIQSRPCQPSPAQPRQGQLNSAQPGPSQPSEAQVFLLRLKLQAEEKTLIPHQYLQQQNANDCINKNSQQQTTRNRLQTVCASQRVRCNNNLNTLCVEKLVLSS